MYNKIKEDIQDEEKKKKLKVLWWKRERDRKFYFKVQMKLNCYALIKDK